MSMAINPIQGTLAANVAPAGTLTVSYPANPLGNNYNGGDFLNSVGHSLVVAQSTLSNPRDFSLTFGTSSITVTNNSASTWLAGTDFILSLKSGGRAVYITNTDYPKVKALSGTSKSGLYIIDFGAPDSGDSDGVMESQSVTAGVDAVLNGVTVSGGVASLDVARNVNGSWTNTAIATVYGYDIYGNPMQESSASGTSFVGVKAFKRVTRVTFNANVTGAIIGFSDSLGLPVFLPSRANILQAMLDGVRRPVQTIVPWFADSTDLLAGTSQFIVTPYGGHIDRATAVVWKAIGTGGDVTFKQGGTTVSGLTLTVPSGALVGATVTDQPTTLTGYDAVASDNGAIEVVFDAAFNTTGALSGYIDIKSAGTFQLGLTTGGGATATSADVRGTWKPPLGCNGSRTWQLLVSLPSPDYIGTYQYSA